MVLVYNTFRLYPRQNLLLCEVYQMYGTIFTLDIKQGQEAPFLETLKSATAGLTSGYEGMVRDET